MEVWEFMYCKAKGLPNFLVLTIRVGQVAPCTVTCSTPSDVITSDTQLNPIEAAQLVTQVKTNQA